MTSTYETPPQYLTNFELRQRLLRRNVEIVAATVLAVAEHDGRFVGDVLDGLALPKWKDADVREYLGFNG